VDDGFEEVDDWVCFDLNKPSTLIQLDGQNLFFRNPEDFSIISTFPFDNGFYTDLLNLDYIHRKVLCLHRYDFFKLRIFDLDQGTMMKEIPVPNSKNYVITGNTLLSTSGLRMDFTYLL
jgi:glutamine cyclotransferase